MTTERRHVGTLEVTLQRIIQHHDGHDAYVASTLVPASSGNCRGGVETRPWPTVAGAVTELIGKLTKQRVTGTLRFALSHDARTNRHVALLKAAQAARNPLKQTCLQCSEPLSERSVGQLCEACSPSAGGAL